MEDRLIFGRLSLTRRSFDCLVIALFLIVTLSMFGDVLFTSQPVILSHQTGDLFNQFIHWREFGFSELRKGNLPLWNPYIYSGAPFLGGFQSALLYPLNLIFLFLPLAKAINWSIVIHVALLGLFMYQWAKHRGQHPLACLLSAILLVFGSTYFLRIYAGHLSNLCTMTWVPVLLLTVAHLFERISLKWILIGMFAVSMQILAGHPQYVFYSAMAVGLSWLMRPKEQANRFKVALALLAIYIGASSVSAIQLFPGLASTAESARGEGVPYDFAASFSFAPKQILTLLSPLFFGDSYYGPYWGSGMIWEMTFFFGVVGLFLAIYGAIYGQTRLRGFTLSISALLFVLALGSYTPFFKVLYDFLPGFDKFRATARFTFFVSLFATLLAGRGFHEIMRSGIRRRTLTIACLLLTTMVGVIAALSVRYSASFLTEGAWGRMLHPAYLIADCYAPQFPEREANYIFDAGGVAFRNLITSSLICFVLAAIVFISKFYKNAVYFIGLLAVTEILTFAAQFRAANPIEYIPQPEVADFLEGSPGDYRVLVPYKPNSTMSFRARNITGDDTPVYRYAEFIFHTQGFRPEAAAADANFCGFPNEGKHKLYSMLRCKYAFAQDGSIEYALRDEQILDRAELISDWKLISDRDAIFAAMDDPSFDPMKTVILEQTPDPEPEPSNNPGTAKVLEFGTDHTIVEVETDKPTILLNTGLYCEGWRAWGLEGSAQKKYHFQPANYILRAIPLVAGHHKIRIEYLPVSFQVGKWLTVLSLVVYIGFWGWFLFRRKEAPCLSSDMQPALVPCAQPDPTDSTTPSGKGHRHRRAKPLSLGEALP